MNIKKSQKQLALFNHSIKPKISHVIKRNGQIGEFDRSKIFNAIFKAANSVGEKDKTQSEDLTDKVIFLLNKVYPSNSSPSVEEIQDLIEKILIENGHTKTAKSFILYRSEHERIRSKKEEKIIVDDNIPYKVLFRVFTWNVDQDCHTVEKLNQHIRNNSIKELIKKSEKAYHDEIKKVADMIYSRLPHVRLVIVAGPSSSGKTTTTTKISERLNKKGLNFLLLNLDNYFMDLEKQPKDEYGDYNFETPQALDLSLINEHLEKLLDGQSIQMPLYNFKTGKREKKTQKFSLHSNQILLIDSLHGLYEGMTQSIPPEMKFKFYIEALCQIKNNQGQFIRWADLRMIRRMVRDNWHRSYDPLRTVGHWHYVRRSEMRYIVPFMNSVDYIFNGALPYELPFYKKFLLDGFDKIIKYFEKDPKKIDAFIRAERVYRLLQSLETIDENGLVPQNSLLREFIGGSIYKY